MRTYIKYLLLLTLTSNIMSQEKQVYQGKFTLDNGIEGIANYQYIEKNYERIYDGYFKYNAKPTTGFERIVTGQFKDNMKHGQWTYIYRYKGVETVVAKGSFNEGMLNGVWEHTTKENINARANFLNGVIVGEYNYRLGRKYEIIGKFNHKGEFDGEWKIRNDGIEDIRRYKNGVLYWWLVRNTTTGEILVRFDDESRVKAYFQSYDETIETVNINGKKYTVKPGNNAQNQMETYERDNNKTVEAYQMQSRIRELEQPLHFFYDMNYNIRMIYGRGEQAKKPKYFEYRIVDYYTTNDGLKEIEAKRLEELNIRTDSLNKVRQEKIEEERKKKLIEQKEIIERLLTENELEKAYEILMQINDKNPEDKDIIKRIEETQPKLDTLKLYLKQIEEANNQIDQRKYEEALLAYENLKELLDNVLLPKSYQLDNLKHEPRNINYVENRIEEIKERLKRVRKEQLKSDIIKLRDATKEKHIYIEAKYFQVVRVLGENIPRYRKSNIYDAYVKVYEYKSFNNNEEEKNHLDRLTKLQERMIGYIEQNTKELERMLKRKTDYNEIITIFDL